MKISKKLVGVLVGVIASLVLIPNVFAHTITFNTMGAGDIDPIEVEDGGQATLPENMVKNGYTFAYWTTDEDGRYKFYPETIINESKTLYAKWISNENVIKSLKINVVLPAIGTKINKVTKDPSHPGIYTNSPQPYATTNPNSHCVLWNVVFMSGFYNEDGMSYGEAFEPIEGTIEEGEYYYVGISITPEDGYIFADDFYASTEWTSGIEPVSNRMTIPAGIDRLNDRTVILKVKAVDPTKSTSNEPQSNIENPFDDEENKEETTKEETTKTIDVLDGKDQKYDANSEDRLKFRFDIALSTFKASGKVYMDGALLDPSNYDLEEGSTIVIFTKAYTDKLKAGNHTIKITTDEGEAEATFSVTKSVENPKTADNFLVYGCLIIVALLGFAISRNEVFNKQN